MPVAATEGAVPSGSIVKLGSYTTQVDKKQSWPDGSLKFGIATCKPTATGSLTPSVVTDPGGSIVPTWPTCTVTFVISAGAGSGSTYVATLPSYVGTDKWLNGALVNEARIRVTPVKSGPTDHDNLRVVFDVRVYNDGAKRVDITVENCRDNANMDSSTYTVTIAIGGSTVFTQSGYKHWSFTAWRKTFNASLTEAGVTLDFEPHYQAKLLPRVKTDVPASDYTTFLSDPLLFGIGRFGLLNPQINSAGGRPDLGWLSAWNVQYLATQNAQAKEVTLRHGEYTASWSLGRVLRNDNTFYRVDDATEGQLFMQAIGGSYPATLRAPQVTDPTYGVTMFRGGRDANVGDDVNYPGASYGGLSHNENLPRLDSEHPVEACTVPYLATGDRFYVDQMKHWANVWMFRTYVHPRTVEGISMGRNYTAGVYGALPSVAFVGTARGFSRPLRTLIHCAHSLPDADSEQSYFRDCANGNLTWLNYYHGAQPSAGTGIAEAIFWEGNTNYYRYDVATQSTVQGGIVYVGSWHLMDLAWPIYWANYVGILTIPSGALGILDRILRFNVGMLSNDSEYPEEFGCPYYPAVGDRTGVATTSSTVGSMVWPATWTAFRQLNEKHFDWLPSGLSATISCNNSTTIAASSSTFTADWVGRNVKIWGDYGTNWNEYTHRNGVRVAHPGVYTIVSVTDATHAVLDRKPCVNGTNVTGGTLHYYNMPAAINGYYGPYGRMAILLGEKRGIAGAATARAFLLNTYVGVEADTSTSYAQQGYALLVE